MGTLVLAVALALAPEASAGAPPAYRGRRLADVLDEMHARGLNVMYSSAVVPPELIVADEPAATEPRAILDQILPSLGLRAVDGARGAILIVRASEADRSVTQPAAPSSRGLPATPRFVENVVVTPSRHEIVPSDLAPARTLTSQDVDLVPTIGGDASRTLALLPGVAAADNSAALSARGSTANDVSLVLDGLELYDPFHLSSFQSPFSFVDGRSVDSVDLLSGGFTADRGDRHGGFALMTSASPAESAATQLEVGTIGSRLSYEAPTPRGTLLVSGRYGYPDAVGSSIELGERGLNTRLADLYVKCGLVATPRTMVSGHALMGYDTAHFQESGGVEQGDSANRSAYLWLRVINAWAPALAMETVVSAGRLTRYRQGLVQPADEPVFVRDDRETRFVGVRSDATWTLGRSQLLKAGFDVRRLGADFDYARGPVSAAPPTLVSASGDSLAAYVAHRTAVSDRLATEVGLRWDRQSYVGGAQWSPRLNAAWRPSLRSELRLGAGVYYQSQRIHELQIQDGETAYHPAERSRQIDLAYLQGVTDRFSLRIDAYRNDLTRLRPRYENLFRPVELFPDAETDRVTVAPESATLQGIEISLQGEGAGSFQWWASATWSSATDLVGGAEVPRSWDQPYAGKFLVSYRWRRGWYASISGTAHTGWPSTPVSGSVVTLPDGSTSVEPVVGPRNSIRFPIYARLDAKLGRDLAVRRGLLRVELEVENLTDRENPCCVNEDTFVMRPDGSVGTERSYDYWLGVTPSFRILWTF